jgi:hypothetical protein
MVVHPDSSRISRVRPYSGTYPTKYIVFADGAITLYGGPFQDLWLTMHTIASFTNNWKYALQHPLGNGWHLSRQAGLGCSPFARHY